MFKVKQGCWYSQAGMWVQLEDGLARAGVTDFAQQTSGDVAFVALPRPGSTIRQGASLGEIETVKVTFDVTSPVSGGVREVNPALEDSPELVNQDPYGAGWLVLVELSDWETDRANLLTAEQYLDVMRAQAEEEAKNR
ncbi:MAG: glycine cleavage system protein H [Chloroflexi bacterium RBG_16_57_9]|nr:MAG: glycine cleavage system protein H [Chloroflexi bacterium RBG_16_57_9]